jgi:2-methylfumaryl-CoA isomerase
MRVLEGLRIVEGSAFVAAPLGGMTLAQLGADVVRVDDLGGGIDFHRWPSLEDGTSLFWAGMNKGKRSLAVDMRSREGQELVSRLITAPGPDRGVFLSSFPSRGWLSYERLRAMREDLIYVNILGNPDGSAAVDYTINPASGFASVTGPASWAVPTNHVLPAWDIATGLTAATGLLAAERYRSRTGVGQHVRVALADVAFAMVANLGYFAQAEILHQNRAPIGNDLYGAFGRDFVTQDGRRIMVVGLSRKQWQALVTATGIGEFLPAIEQALGVDLKREGDRFIARDAIAALIGAWCARRTLAEIADVFDRHEVCWGPYQTFRELLEQDWRATPRNPIFADIEQPGIGRTRAASSPLRVGELAIDPPRPAPRLGEHTEQVLAEDLGLPHGEIARLHDTGIVASPGRVA